MSKAIHCVLLQVEGPRSRSYNMHTEKGLLIPRVRGAHQEEKDHFFFVSFVVPFQPWFVAISIHQWHTKEASGPFRDVGEISNTRFSTCLGWERLL